MSLKEWFKWNRPIFMTRSKLFGLLVEDSEKVRKNNDELNWIAISEVIESLKELRKNTWDTGRVDEIVHYLKREFEP